MSPNKLSAFTLVPPTLVGPPRMTAGKPATTSRRAALRLLAAVALGIPSVVATNAAAASADTAPDGSSLEGFEAMTTRRYLLNGRPKPENPPPAFKKDRPVFDVAEGLRAQDVNRGNGSEAASVESLVVARWRVLLDDGSLIDDSNLKQPALFRPGAHQVPPGIEDAVIGMRPGGTRLVTGSAERILTDVAMGYDIGERSVVPNNSQLYIEIAVDRLDPYGKQR